MRRFQRAAEILPKSAIIAFSLGQEYEYIGDSARMFALFDRSVFPKVGAGYALVQSRYAYLWGDFARGIAYVRPIFDAYFKLGSADDNFLFLRGLPFFHETWSYVAAFCELQGNLSVLEELTAKSKARLSDYEFDLEDAYLDALRSGDFSGVIAALRGERGGIPDLMRASIEALKPKRGSP